MYSRVGLFSSPNFAFVDLCTLLYICTTIMYICTPTVTTFGGWSQTIGKARRIRLELDCSGCAEDDWCYAPSRHGVQRCSSLVSSILLSIRSHWKHLGWVNDGCDAFLGYRVKGSYDASNMVVKWEFAVDRNSQYQNLVDKWKAHLPWPANWSILVTCWRIPITSASVFVGFSSMSF